MDKYLLHMRNIYKKFSGVNILENVDFNLKHGEVHILLGENGAGKSTLIKILSGAYELTSGKVYIEEELVNIKNPKDGINKGISVIYQEFNLNPYMSIYENIFLGKEYKSNHLIDFKAQKKEAEKVCKEIGLNLDVNLKIKNLSIAEKQLVEIAKALVTKSKIIVFDEPTATLTDIECERLFKLIKQLKESNIGIIYISHRMEELSRIGDRVTVLRDGKYVGTKNIKEVSESELIKMIAGKEVSIERRKGDKSDKLALRVNNLYSKDILSNISFHLYKGEILGIAGLVGSGRTEIAKCLIGQLPLTSGEIILNDKEYKPKSPGYAIKRGIALISEDRKGEGLVLDHSIKRNIMLPSLNNIKRLGNINLSLEKKKSNELINQFNIKYSDINSSVSNLSGGNQQKVVIAKWIYKGADIYIIDEPTRGIDIGSRSEIYEIMEKLLETGAAIIMISSDLIEIMKLSDRVLIMHEGKVSGELPNTSHLTKETILRYAMGREINYVI